MSSLDTRIQHKKDTVDNWITNDPVLLDGELIIVVTGTDDNEKELTRFKIGDGDSKYSELPFTDQTLYDNIELTAEGLSNQVSGLSSDIDDINKQLADILYKAISITKFTNNRGTVEKGSTVTSVTLSWEINKSPNTLTLNGSTIENTKTSHTYDNLNITSDTTYNLVAKDEREATSSKSTSITFLNGVYYGAITKGTTVDSTAILALTRKLQSSRSITFTTTAGENQYIVYAIPARYGAPSFNVGGFDGGFNLSSVIDFKNASGYTESYNVYFSDNLSLGETTVKVS